MKHLPTLSYLPGPGSCVCLATYRATRRRLHRSSWLALVVKPARLLSGGVLFSLQFRSGFVASCAVGLLLTVLGYFVAVLARGVANSRFRPCVPQLPRARRLPRPAPERVCKGLPSRKTLFANASVS